MLSFKKDETKNVVAGQPFDIGFTAPAGTAELTAVFKNGSSAEITTQGFYNGEDEYLLRASLPEPGTWTYTTKSNAPQLDGKTGTVEVSADEDKKYRSVKIDPKRPDRLVYSDGSDFFLLAYEADWLPAIDYENETGTPRTDHFLDRIKQNGYNQVIFSFFAHSCKWLDGKTMPPEYNFANPPGYPFLGSNQEPDFSGLNHEYFQKLDRTFEALCERGISAHLMIYVWNKNVTWPDMYSEADNLFFDYIIKRYQAFPNLVWNMAKEALYYGRCDEDYVKERIERIRRLDGYGRLVCVHDEKYCVTHPDTVDLIAAQIWNVDIYSRMRDLVERFPQKAVFNIEHGGYEKGPVDLFYGNFLDPKACLYRNYEVVFSGSYSSYYWQSSSWSTLFWEPDKLPKDQRPRWYYYKILAGLFKKYPFNELTAVDRSTAGYDLEKPGEVFLSYVPPGVGHYHCPGPVLEKKPKRVACINITTGAEKDIADMEGPGWVVLENPWPEEAMVVIVETISLANP